MTLREHELKLTVASQADLSLEIGTFQEKAEFFEPFDAGRLCSLMKRRIVKEG